MWHCTGLPIATTQLGLLLALALYPLQVSLLMLLQASQCLEQGSKASLVITKLGENNFVPFHMNVPGAPLSTQFRFCNQSILQGLFTRWYRVWNSWFSLNLSLMPKTSNARFWFVWLSSPLKACIFSSDFITLISLYNVFFGLFQIWTSIHGCLIYRAQNF